MNGSDKYTPVNIAIKKFLFYRDWSKSPQPVEYVSLIDAKNRVLAKSLSSPINVPPFLRAIMDGYAIKSNDTKGASNRHPVFLDIIGRITAGQDRRFKVRPGKAVAIATGTRIPEDSDAVVMMEQTKVEDCKVKIFKEIKRGTNTAVKGGDVKKGQILLKKGTWLTSQDLGLVASLGINKVPVFRRPRVAIFSTGDELVEPGSELHGALIFESNRYMISSMIHEYGGEAIDLGICRDDRSLISSKLSEALKFDLTVVSGGTSAGETDYLPDLVNMMGKPGLLIRGVAIKPGSPTGLGIVNDKPVILCPGYPVSSFVAFYTFGRPLLFKILQTEGPPRANLVAKIRKSIVVHKNMRTFVRVNVVKMKNAGGSYYAAYPVSASGASLLSTLTNSNGMVIVDNKDSLRRGEKVEVIPLRSIAGTC